jgi:hypothetical protein
MMNLTVKTPGSLVDFQVAEGNRWKGGKKRMKDLNEDT